jgi:hypothetical protein
MVSRIHGNCKEEIKARLSRASRSACLLHKRTLGKTKTRDSVKNIYIYIKFICDPRFTLERTKSIKERERERGRVRREGKRESRRPIDPGLNQSRHCFSEDIHNYCLVSVCEVHCALSPILQEGLFSISTLKARLLKELLDHESRVPEWLKSPSKS